MVIDYEKWHDGVGYDLDALRQVASSDLEEIEEILIHRNPLDWRDIEALATLNTPGAKKVLRAAFSDRDPIVRLAVSRYALEKVSDEEHTSSIVQALRTTDIFWGLSQALDEVEEFHPTEVIDELFRGVLKHDGEVATLFVAMLFFLYGKADSPFDMEQRPLLPVFQYRIDWGT